MIHLIDKAAVIAEIERKVKSINSCPFRYAELGSEKLDEGELNAYNEMLSFINTLEVKEVDLEKEIEEHANCMPMSEFTHDSEAEDFYEWAKEEFKYFFILGLKAQKGEKV